MKAKGSTDSNSVRVILDEVIKKPWCPHGPTLLFESTSQGAPVKFFACSACRNRDDCPFYLEYTGEPLKETENSTSGRKNLVTYEEVSSNQYFSPNFKLH